MIGRACLVWALPLLVGLAAHAYGSEAGALDVPWTPVAWVPDGADARWVFAAEGQGIEATARYIRAPRPNQAYGPWLSALHELRRQARANTQPGAVQVDYRGVRAWTRIRWDLGRELDLAAGERLQVRIEARWLSGNPELCFAFDFLDPASGRQVGWSGVVATVTLPRDGAWHALEREVVVPPFNRATSRANLIVGQDATRDPTPGVWGVRSIALRLPATPQRARAVQKLRAAAARAAKGLDRSLYDRPEMAWGWRNFACYFAFIYDTGFYDRRARAYRVAAFLDEMNREFGGIDSVVLWHAYPRIGVDQRNQFDFYRDMPGGLAGVRDLVRRFRRKGVRVFVDYNPWDTGTRREDVPDEQAIARLVKAVEADGVFLDTMVAGSEELRAAVDRARRGVIFEPEGAPPVDQLAICGSSWAQFGADYPEPAVLRLKWVEPRHMQHQTQRWSTSHAAEIESAFFNGSGMLLWENIFGTYNPCRAADRYLWRRAVPILRTFAPELASESWEPCMPTLTDGVFASRWQGRWGILYLLVNRSPQEPAREVPVLRLPTMPRGARILDLWQRAEMPLPTDDVLRLRLERLGAVAIVRNAAGLRRVRALLTTPPEPPPAGPNPRLAARPHDPRPVERTPPPDMDDPPVHMRFVPRTQIHMRIRHERRECGCYPDPGSPPEQQAYFTFGAGFLDDVVHDYGPVTVGPLLVDECLVTNADYQAFLDATGYTPAEPRNFLKHWGGRRCPPALRDHPVVYVDLDDARAYARWAGLRLPTEEEWQLAAQGTDGRRWPWGADFDPARCNGSGPGTTPVRAFPQGRSPYGCYDMAGNAWQWTESERDDGHTRYAILRGGSYFEAKGSIWYVRGGPQPLDRHTKFILMYPGLDRCATIGFRCVRDVAAPPVASPTLLGGGTRCTSASAWGEPPSWPSRPWRPSRWHATPA